MDYNNSMKITTPRSDAVRLIRFAAFLWIGYILVLALISQSFPGPQRTSLLYYVLLGYIALLCLCLAYWPWIQRKLKQAFVGNCHNYGNAGYRKSFNGSPFPSRSAFRKPGGLGSGNVSFLIRRSSAGCLAI